jgi:hypothetical protein
MARWKLCGALDFDVRLHSHLHARFVPHQRRNELVAGNLHDFSRQRHRCDSDDSECTCRNTLPGFLVNVKLLDAANVPPFFVALYNYAWFVGFALAFVVYLVLRKIAPQS